MSPFACGSLGQISFLDGSVRRADRFLAITGPYWARRIGEGPLAHWAARTEPVDLAVSTRDFPRVKGAFAPPGRRRILYVGNTTAPKNVGYLSQIAGAMPDVEFAWAGTGTPIARVRALGQLDFSSAEARRLVASHDFLLTVGASDANPATILEAMAWGLVPVCTPQSGYEGEPGIVNVPLGDVPGAVRVLRNLQATPVEELEALRAANDRQLESRFTWGRFTAQVEAAVDRPGREPALSLPVARRAGLALASMRAPSSPLRPANVLGLLRTNLERRMAPRRPRGMAA